MNEFIYRAILNHCTLLPGSVFFVNVCRLNSFLFSNKLGVPWDPYGSDPLESDEHDALSLMDLIPIRQTQVKVFLLLVILTSSSKFTMRSRELKNSLIQQYSSLHSSFPFLLLSSV